MKPEKRHLLDDLLNDDDAETRRQTTLQAGRQVLHRRRLFRLTSRLGLVGAVVAVILVASLREFTAVRRPTVPPVVVAPLDDTPRTMVQVEFITDDQLLALFPGTPVGLGTAGGKTKLLFPRAGDEARFIIGLAHTTSGGAAPEGTN
jgi:hypothetical protein